MTEPRPRPRRGPDEGDFPSRVRRVIAAIPAGAVASYGEVAVRAGYPGAARAVGHLLALHQGLPWWRVVHADGRLIAGQEERLRAEGVPVSGGRILGAELRARLVPDRLGTPPDMP